MGNQFKPNDIVMYSCHGACTLVEITEKDFGGVAKDYYVLRPAFSGSSIFYVPTDSEPLTSKMRTVKNADEINELVLKASVWDWIEDDRPRQNQLKQAIDCGSTELLVSIYKALYEKQKSLAEDGKKLRAADDRYMKDIEALLVEEFSFSYEIKKDDLVPFLYSEINLTQK
ncbi:MAG: hypothetical protein E7598_08255 [Ruminococcaceae bacterium]|nr:hypothetical protein [Oscillospiraceae bacterium]